MAPIRTTLSLAIPLFLAACGVQAAQAKSAFLGCAEPLATPLNPTPVFAASAAECADACTAKGSKNSFAYYHSTSVDSCVCSSIGPDEVYDIAYPAGGSCADYEVAVYVTRSGHSFVSQNKSRRHLDRMERIALSARDVKADCPNPLQACKVKNDEGYQCIDPQYAIDSCGGCINGAFGDATTTPAVDCTALPGVASGGVICSLGQCKAYRCVDGYTLQGNTCVKA
ncbi:hypothetical protein I317_00086 [Kwoniella heveanensis CBS 569]|nr:hypothetical protein I317_00086 [Kwoniella heveanensis CBS 569]